jgi:hypothetical protein
MPAACVCHPQFAVSICKIKPLKLMAVDISGTQESV